MCNGISFIGIVKRNLSNGDEETQYLCVFIDL